MHWLQFVKKFREDHPHMSYKAALKASSAPFKEHTKKQKYEEPKLKRAKKKKNEPEDCGCHFETKAKLSKSLRDKIKKECGVCVRKTGAPKKLLKPRVGSGSSKARKAKRAKRTSKTSK